MRIAENDASSKRKLISVFNTAEKLNKHRSVCINYLRVLASARGTSFTSERPPQQQTEGGGATAEKFKEGVQEAIA